MVVHDQSKCLGKRYLCTFYECYEMLAGCQAVESIDDGVETSVIQQTDFAEVNYLGSS